MNISDDQLDVADWRKVQSVEHISTMLSCVCNAIGNAQAEQTAALERIAAALEQIAGAVEAQRLNHVASLTVGELMAALQPLMDGEADADDDYAELDTETHEDTNAGRTDYYTLLLEDGMRATVTMWHDDGGTGAYVMAPVDDLFAPNPQALHDLAARFRAYAKAFDNLAELWDADRRTGVIPTKESER